MKIPLLDLPRQYAPLKAELFKAWEKQFDEAHFVLGKEVEDFESAMADFFGLDTTVGVSNGTDAIWIALKAAGVKPGDHVITVPFTFFATISATVNAGAVPVFCDIIPETYSMCPTSLEEALHRDKDRRIKAIIPVHLYGQAAAMDPILKLAEKYGLAVIEDAAQAIGTQYRGKKVGTLGTLGSFSFFPSKNLGGVGDGGLVTSRDPKLSEAVRLIRTHGSVQKYYHERIGGNYRLDAFQATALSIFLPHLPQWIEARQDLARKYDEAFRGHDDVLVTPYCAAESTHTYHQYTVRVLGGRRDSLREFLTKKEIGHGVYYPVPCHLQKALAYLEYRPGSFPVSEQASAETVSLPIFPGMTSSEQGYVVESILAWKKQG